MQKILSLFRRDHATGRVVDEVTPGAEWVTAGEGVPTRKWDGTCCLVRDGKLFKRYEVKAGGTPPRDFEAATGVDLNTGKRQGWVPVGGGPEDRWHREAFDALVSSHRAREERLRTGEEAARGVPGESVFPLKDGTYELIGPKVQGNPEQYPDHCLVRHGAATVWAPVSYDNLYGYFLSVPIEGVVWHHPDGRMVKIKAKDFGLPRSSADIPSLRPPAVPAGPP